jgi:putative acetyltransferase
MRTGGPTIRVVGDGDDAGLGLVSRLFRSYAAEFADSIAETLCFQGFEAELAGLPGRYAQPSGCLLLAMEDDVPAGCVAVRDLGDGTCEAPGRGGRQTGRADGLSSMVLDTFPEMAGALALYRESGFVETIPYWEHPIGRAVFMERPLGIM